MIKKFIALAASLSIVFVFSACGDDDNKSSSSTSAAEITEAQTTEITTEAAIEAPYEVDTTEPQESDIAITDGVLESSYYTLGIGDDWDLTTGSDVMALIKRKGESALDSSSDIAIVYSEQYEGKSSEEVLNDFKSQYDAMEEYVIDNAEVVKIGDYDAVSLDISFDLSEAQTKIKQVYIIGDDGGVTITYAALADTYDETISEIDDMISTIVLK